MLCCDPCCQLEVRNDAGDEDDGGGEGREDGPDQMKMMGEHMKTMNEYMKGKMKGKM